MKESICAKCKVGILRRWYNRLFKCDKCSNTVLVYEDGDGFW